MTKRINFDYKLKRKYLKNIARTKIKYKIWQIIRCILYACAVTSVVGLVWLLVKENAGTDAIWMFGAVELIFLAVFLIPASSIKNTSLYASSLPYSKRVNESLYLEEDRLDYIFWEVPKNSPAAYSKNCELNSDEKSKYTIYKTDITNISIDENNICTIKGFGIVEVPDSEKYDYDKEKTNKKEYRVKSFSILLCFDEENICKKIFEWKNQ